MGDKETAAEETTKDFKQVMVYILMAIMGILGWFLNDFMAATKTSFGNIYSYRDVQNQAKIDEAKAEAAMWEARYFDCFESKIP